MKKISTIIMSFLFMIILSVVVLSEDLIYQTGHSELPFIASQNLTIVGDINSTVLFNYGQFSSGIPNHTFIDKTFINLKISFNVSNSTQVGNYSRSVFIIYKNGTQKTNLSYLIRILNDTPSPVIDTDFIRLDINKYRYPICDFQLPHNFTLPTVSVSGRHGQIVQSKFDENYFVLPKEFVIPITNITVFDILVKVPNLTSGLYFKTINFSTVGKFSHINFEFEVNDCIIPFPSLDSLIKICSIENKTPSQFIECERLKSEQQRSVYEALLEAQEKTFIQNKTTEYINITQRVPVLDLDNPDVVKALKDIPITFNQMIVDNRQKQRLIDEKIGEIEKKNNMIEQLINEKDDAIEKIPDEVRKAVETQVHHNTLLQERVDDLEKSRINKSFIYIAIITIIIISSLVFTIKKVFIDEVLPI